MKKAIKKISAIAMAFTLLGTGTFIVKNVNPKANNILVASAACQFHDGSLQNGKRISNYDVTRAKKTGAKYCRCCGQFVGWYNGVSYDGSFKWQNGNRVPIVGPHPTPAPKKK